MGNDQTGRRQLEAFLDAAKIWCYWQRRAVTRNFEESKRRIRARDNLLAAIDEFFGQEIDPLPASITCPTCACQSFNPQDVREGYCGNCHDWTSLPHQAR